ncbi:MAG TPA: chromate transporter, partial [Candidatus Limnocylindrales bacterium]|nr:chromate transporter [Candidatus Limnocylindrales bacterium]
MRRARAEGSGEGHQGAGRRPGEPRSADGLTAAPRFGGPRHRPRRVSPAPRPPGRAREVFVESLRLGLTSFGGPIAHLGYQRRAFVERLAWVDEETFAAL